MKQSIFLDSAPLGLLFQKAGIVPAEACRAWAKERMSAGARLLVPEIIHYEIRRELLRLRKTNSLNALEKFVRAESDRFCVLTSRDLDLAAELWAESRRRGMPTADTRALDIDVILAAQVTNSGIPISDLVVATTNSKHLSQFIPAEEWSKIV
jgi:predicted nucleic acid-binding protein